MNVLIHAIKIEGLVDFARAETGAILQSPIVVPLDVIGSTVPRKPGDYAGCRRRAYLCACAFRRVSNQEKNAKSNQRSSKGVMRFHTLRLDCCFMSVTCERAVSLPEGTKISVLKEIELESLPKLSRRIPWLIPLRQKS
jgi:hypothetical protein